jgi:hypothetical protein
MGRHYKKPDESANALWGAAMHARHTHARTRVPSSCGMYSRQARQGKSEPSTRGRPAVCITSADARYVPIYPYLRTPKSAGKNGSKARAFVAISAVISEQSLREQIMGLSLVKSHTHKVCGRRTPQAIRRNYHGGTVHRLDRRHSCLRGTGCAYCHRVPGTAYVRAQLFRLEGSLIADRPWSATWWAGADSY